MQPPLASPAPPSAPPAAPGKVPGGGLVVWGSLLTIASTVLSTGLGLYDYLGEDGRDVAGRHIAIDAPAWALDAAHVAAPTLAGLGALLLVIGWLRARGRARKFPAGAILKVARWRKGGWTGTILMLLNMAAAGGVYTVVDPTADTGGGATTTSFITQLDSSCQWGTGRATTCVFVITNAAESNVTFHWVGESSPGGATFEPESGTLAPGQTSEPINMIDGQDCPLVIRFVDTEQDLQIEYTLDDPCT